MMSAEQTPLDNSAAEAGKPTVSQAILTWMREQESTAPDTVEREAARAGRRDSTPENGPGAEDFETVAFLLRAIEGTETAARLMAESNSGHRSSPAQADNAFASPVVALPEDAAPQFGETQPEKQSGTFPAPPLPAVPEDVRPVSAPEILEARALGQETQSTAVEPAASADDTAAGNAATVADLPPAVEGAEPTASLMDAAAAGDRQFDHQPQPEPENAVPDDGFELTALDLPAASCVTPQDSLEAPASQPLPPKASRMKGALPGSTAVSASKATRPAAVPVLRSKRQRRSHRLTVFALPMGSERTAIAPAEEKALPLEEIAEAESSAPGSAVEVTANTGLAFVAPGKEDLPSQAKIVPVSAVPPLPVFYASMFPPAPPLFAREESTSAAAALPVFVDSIFPRVETAVSEQELVANAASLPLLAEVDSAGTAAPAKSNGASTGLAAKIDSVGERMARAELQFEKWVQGLFKPKDPRRGERVVDPPLIAYHWIVDTPQALKVANISSCGLCLVTDYRWSEGNIVSMTLQRTDLEKDHPDSWIAVDFIVVRWCREGLAGTFIPATPGKLDAVAGRAENTADKPTLERFVARLSISDPQ